MPGFRLRGRKNTSGGGDDGGGGGSRMEERLRTARILASDDEEDEEHVARRRRTRTQIERDLNNPKVHKRIVENLYFAYKMRVSSSSSSSSSSRFLSRVFRRRKQNLSMKSFRCALAFIGVLGLNDLAPPPHFPRTILVGRLS